MKFDSGIEIVKNEFKSDTESSLYLKYFTDRDVSRVSSYHKTIPGFTPTPLISLDQPCKQSRGQKDIR